MSRTFFPACAMALALIFTVQGQTTINGNRLLSGTLNRITLTPPASGSTFTLADGKTLTVSNTITFTATDGSSVALGTGGTVLYNGGPLGTPSSATLTNATGCAISTCVSGLGTNVATFLGTPSSANLAAGLTDETGTSLAVFNTSPLLVTPKVTTITDANGNPFILSSATASAVDSITITNAATANPATVTIAASGSDSNVNLNLLAKGTGLISFPGSQGDNFIQFVGLAGADGDITTSKHNSSDSTRLILKQGGTFIWSMGSIATNGFALKDEVASLDVLTSASNSGLLAFPQLKTTGAASGKTVVCVDTATGIIYASTSAVTCAN